MESQIIAKVYRGETLESVHRGHLIVVEGDGNIVRSLGNPDTVTFFRSAAKAFQAIPFIVSGAADRFGFLESEIALACASHSGENAHIEIASGMLEKIGLSESDLRCGAHLPFHEKTATKMILSGEKPTQIHNNCSGKHAAMLGFAKHIDAEIRNYEAIENPIQQAILDCVSQFADVPKSEIRIGVDGCAAPNFALPVSAMAKSFSRLTFPQDFFDEDTREACRRVVSAMIKYPEFIGGTERLDTEIMKAANGKVISKVGAEGIYVAGVLPSDRWKKGLGIAFKIEDGDDKRARPVIAVELLRQLGVLKENDLTEISPMTIRNRRGDIVGKVLPVIG